MRQKTQVRLAGAAARRAATCRIIAAEMLRLRKAAGLSQDQASEAGGFDRTFPSLLERKLRVPRLPTFIRYVRSLGADPAEVVARLEKKLDAEGLLQWE